MKKIQMITALTSTLILMAGCSTTQPSFDPKNTKVEVVNGKSYNIPVGAHSSPYVNAEVITFYQEIGLSECKQGDITWEENKAKDEMGEAISKGDKSIYKKLAKEGLIGCASPIAK
jgi:PBP1b-binding outer membrane lipoprotein LpoB